MEFIARGKLLITGEYAVLHGAEALAVPTVICQTLKAEPQVHAENLIGYSALNFDGTVWFSIRFDPETLAVSGGSLPAEAGALMKALHWIREQNPSAIQSLSGYGIETRLGFPRNWGLGSSSTFVYLISRLFNVDAYALNSHLFGGSGYDIACASALEPIIFSRNATGEIVVRKVSFPLLHHPAICWVWQNRKVATGKAVLSALTLNFTADQIARINQMTTTAASARSIRELSDVLHHHESLMSEVLGIQSFRQQFPDFPGVIKSLGAWGGDFFMAINAENPDDSPDFFKSRGYTTVLTSRDLFAHIPED